MSPKHQNPVENKIAALRAMTHMKPKEVAKKFNVHVSTLYTWQTRWEQTRDLSRRPYPLSIKRFKLTPSEIRRLYAFHDQNPKATYQDLAVHLDHKICVDTVAEYIRRRKGKPKISSSEIPPHFNLIMTHMTLPEVMHLSELLCECLPEYEGCLKMAQ